MNNAIAKPNGKKSKAEEAQEAFARLLIESSRRGFYGTVGLTLSVQDGHIQHLRLLVEEVRK